MALASPVPAAAPAEPQQSAAQRFIAIRHDILMFFDESAVESAWQHANRACAAAACDILSAGFDRSEQQRPPTAMLDVRIPAARVEAFLAELGTLGGIASHTKTAEDKTNAVIDTEAAIKNNIELRDKLRLLVRTPRAKLQELIELERELARVQSRIDSLSGQRKLLAEETEKVRISLRLAVRPSVVRTGMWQPLRNAVNNMGYWIASSAAAVIELMATALPWLLLGGGTWFVLRLLWRRRALRKAKPV